MSYKPRFFSILLAFISVNGLTLSRPSQAAELEQLSAKNFDRLVPAGKEADAIYGDWVLRNERVTIVIARPTAGRNANMTVRGVGGMIIDMTRRSGASDQLSCFYPGAGRYLFDAEDSVVVTANEKTVDLTKSSAVTGKTISFSAAGQPIAENQTTARVTYTLRDGQDWLEYQVDVTNHAAQPQLIVASDSLRCDGAIFRFGNDEERRLFYAEDAYFGQCYGFIANHGVYERAADKRTLVLKSGSAPEAAVAQDGQRNWGGKVYCSQGLPGVRSWAAAQAAKQSTIPLQVKLDSPHGVVEHARVELLSGDKSLGTIDSNAEGLIRTELLPGKYHVKVVSMGREVREHAIEISDKPLAESLSLSVASRVKATITDGAGEPIAAKVQFVPAQGTDLPDFGPDAGIYAIKNVVYCARGKFEQAINPGKYQAIISHGPEYDADMQDIEVRPGQLVLLKSTLKRTVNTSGWISSDFHSHSSPSGDNVSHQLGRVLNLLAEHIEFAPCTEHNRIDTYADDLEYLKATTAMATCTGMELTGSPLPINHQNAFPLHRHEHLQDGGGPVTDTDPVKQIERLALWDLASSKVVQTNHPNIPQILGDRDLDNKVDEGFRGMLGWMDVIEVHPPEGIFTPPAANITGKDKYSNPIFYWLQLLNLGYRIPGVVNTDAHYNFHGSGWLRNYMECSTDDPVKIGIDEIIHVAEHGHMIMTTGPFLEAQVRLQRESKDEFYISGEDVELKGADARIWVRVQCPNWFDVNRVQVFANGKPLTAMNFTRQSHPDLFSDQSIRFESEIALPKFAVDTHVIVATVGEGLTLGPVMGAERGKTVPCAVANPIFLDVDGSGFQANGDDLGVPIMLPVATEAAKK